MTAEAPQNKFENAWSIVMAIQQPRELSIVNNKNNTDTLAQATQLFIGFVLKPVAHWEEVVFRPRPRKVITSLGIWDTSRVDAPITNFQRDAPGHWKAIE